MKSTYSIQKKILTFLTLVSLCSINLALPIASLKAAVYSESINDTFLFYKQKLEWSIQDLEREFRVNGSVGAGTISTIRNLVNEAYIRLPDNGENANKNSSAKKSVDLYLDLAAKNNSSQTHVSNAAAQASRFLSQAKIEQISGSITATPSSGNAPLISSFLASAKDPSWVTLPDANYIWWVRESYGRRILGTGPTLNYSFTKEWNYQVFLDVISNSRNSKGKVDVLPLTVAQDIEVKPRLGDVILIVNGVNVSNIDQLKISPLVWKVWVLFDATASRAVSNGKITKTKWDFGNGNTLENDGPPLIERQVFANAWSYKVNLTITSNQGQSFSKQLSLVVRDPSAVISMDKEVAFIGDEVRMSAKTYLSNTANVEYEWKVSDVWDSKQLITSQNGSTFSYKFTKVGQYLVSLTSRSPNGSTDTDSRVITIESHPPTVNLESPKTISPERPNTIVFDASRSFDLDTKSAKWLTYTWLMDGEQVELDDITEEWAKGTYSFDKKGQHTVSLTVANAYGKVTTVEKNFTVSSLLMVGVNVTPRAAPIGTVVTFQARSPNAAFYEWNMGDGSPSNNGTSDSIQHTYKKTGIYNATLRVKNTDWTEENSISRTVYVTDTDTPFALIDIKNSSNTIFEDPMGCETANGGSFVVNRSESTRLDGSKSLNIDGNSNGLTYTWKYMGKVKNGSSLSEKFTELGCFPVELTVRSEKNGASHWSTRTIQIKNLAPKLTSITTSMDQTKKDSQKVIVTVNANGARDDDGVITSYVWYYMTESDSEKQNVRITQAPSTTFVLPNITEKYYFGVIIEDNDGARTDSTDTLTDQAPLIVANEDANVNMPLITLSVDKSQVLTDDLVNFSVAARNILGKDITSVSEYYWDFDWDGHIDKKSNEPTATYSYKGSWRYNMKVKVVNNGVSNTKYQTIYVKNELKATVEGYQIGDRIYLINTSRGSYDKVAWNIGTESSENTYSHMISGSLDSMTSPLGTLTIKAGTSEVSTVDITKEMIRAITPWSDINIQTFPAVWASGAIHIASAGEKILISAFGNTAKEYIIDTDTKIDSDLDGMGDNDKDNIDTPSYSDGSVFAMTNLASVTARNREIKITLIGENGGAVGTKVIPVVFEYIPGNNLPLTELSGSGDVFESFSAKDRENVDALQAKIRTLSTDDRIILTQHFNTLVENWWDLHDRTQGLLTIQEAVINSQNLDSKTKDDLSSMIDTILVWDAQATNEISVASRVIEGLIKTDNPNRDYVIERLEKIKAHPGSLSDNKSLGKEILEKIETDGSLSTEDKLLLKSQLLIIINGWQDSVPEEETSSIEEELNNSSGGVVGFISWAVKIFAIIIGIIVLLILLGYIFYRLSRRNESDTGFQDFLIDSIAHNKPKAEPARKDAEAVVKAVEVKTAESTIISPAKTTVAPTVPLVDPLSGLRETWSPKAPEATLVEVQPAPPPPEPEEEKPKEEVHNIPDWLKPITEPAKKQPEILKKELEEKSQDALSNTPLTDNTTSPVDPFASVEETAQTEPVVKEISAETPVGLLAHETPSWERTLPPAEEIIPDWLKPMAPEWSEDTRELMEEEKVATDTPKNTPPSERTPSDLPDWLKASINENPTSDESATQHTEQKKSATPKKRKKPTTEKQVFPKTESQSSDTDIPDWLK
jgi:PKD repeat protein